MQMPRALCICHALCKSIDRETLFDEVTERLRRFLSHIVRMVPSRGQDRPEKASATRLSILVAIHCKPKQLIFSPIEIQ
jgi:ferredoxin